MNKKRLERSYGGLSMLVEAEGDGGKKTAASIRFARKKNSPEKEPSGRRGEADEKDVERELSVFGG